MGNRTLLTIGLVSVALFGAAACGSDDDSSGGTTATSVVDERDVAGATWTLTTLDGEAPPDGVEATLLFDGSAVSGSSGCNQYNGEASFDEDVVAISDQLVGTMMACEPAVSEFEATYLAMLAEAQLFYVDGDTMTFTTDDGTTLAEFTAT